MYQLILLGKTQQQNYYWEFLVCFLFSLLSYRRSFSISVSACTDVRESRPLKPSSLRSCTGRGRIRFLECALRVTTPNFHDESSFIMNKVFGMCSSRDCSQLARQVVFHPRQVALCPSVFVASCSELFFHRSSTTSHRHH